MRIGTFIKILTMKKLIYLILVALLIGGSIGLYLYNKPARDPGTEDAVAQITAVDLGSAYTTDATKASEMYLDQVVEITGAITDQDAEGVVLDGAVYCKMQSGLDKLEVGEQASIKGRVVGYDDLFGQVRLDFAQTADQ